MMNKLLFLTGLFTILFTEGFAQEKSIKLADQEVVIVVELVEDINKKNYFRKAAQNAEDSILKENYFQQIALQDAAELRANKAQIKAYQQTFGDQNVYFKYYSYTKEAFNDHFEGQLLGKDLKIDEDLRIPVDQYLLVRSGYTDKYNVVDKPINLIDTKGQISSGRFAIIKMNTIQEKNFFQKRTVEEGWLKATEYLEEYLNKIYRKASRSKKEEEKEEGEKSYKELLIETLIHNF